MRAVVLFIFLSSVVLAPAPSHSDPVAQQVALVAQLPTPKSIQLLTNLHKKLLVAAGKNKASQERTATFTELKQLMIDYCRQDSSDATPLKILETYLEILTKEKIHTLAASTPEVIRHTNTALRALKKLKLTYPEKHHDVQKMWCIIVKIKQEFLPKKPLAAGFRFGLREAGYSAATILTVMGARAALNARRTPDETPPSNEQILHQDTTRCNNATIELVQLRCPKQTYNECAAHAYGNIFQIIKKITENAHLFDMSFEDKKRFLTTANFEFKDKATIESDIKELNDQLPEGLFKFEYPSGEQGSYYSIYLHLLLNKYFSLPLDLDIDSTFDIFDNKYICSITFLSTDPLSACLDLLTDLIKKSTPLETILGRCTNSLRRSHKEEDGFIPYLDPYVNLGRILKRVLLENCANSSVFIQNEDPFQIAYKAFNDGKFVVFQFSLKTPIKHATANVLFKGESGNEACVLHFDSQFMTPNNFYSLKIHKALKEFCSCFFKYANIREFLEKNKETLRKWQENIQKEGLTEA